MIGPNGFGKTMILRILDTLFNRSVGILDKLPFREGYVTFDDNSILELHRSASLRGNKRTRGRVILEYKRSASARTGDKYDLSRETREDHIPFPLGAIGNIIPTLRKIGPYEWHNMETDEILDLDDVLAEYGEELPSIFRDTELQSPIPQWLETMRTAIPVRFIGTERLTHPSTYRFRNPRRRRDGVNISPRRTVKQYSEELAQRVQLTLTEYAELSQALDRTFPARLVEEPTSPASSVEVLRGKLAEVESKRSKIVEAGLLVQQDEGLRVPVIDEVDASRRGVLAVYAEDALKKLSVFDDLYDRVHLLKTIANSRFRYKNVSVGTRGLEVEAWDGSNLDLEMLSSGEQHELVLLYDLLFTIAEDSFILVDEPELSLHVAWQREILSDLQKIADLSNFHALLATHSPQIIGDRWDLTVTLKGPNEK